MAFRLHQMPSISSYEACEKFYAKARRWESPPRIGNQTQVGEPRKIDKSGKPYKSLRQIKHALHPGKLGYAWRYHETDVVTWMAPDHIIVVPWASLSTTSFMEALLPSGFSVHMAHPLGCLLGQHDAGDPPDLPTYGTVSSKVYEAAMARWSGYWTTRNGQATRWRLLPEHRPANLIRSGDQWAIEGADPIEVPRVDPKRAALARREFATATFSAWLDAMFAMNPGHSLRSFQAHALARATPARGVDGPVLHECIHQNSDDGLAYLQQALRNPELYWSILASPHLRPPARRTRGDRFPRSRTHNEELRDWRKHMKASALLAAYRAHDAVEIVVKPYVLGLDEATQAQRLHEKWGVAYHAWPTVEEA